MAPSPWPWTCGLLLAFSLSYQLAAFVSILSYPPKDEVLHQHHKHAWDPSPRWSELLVHDWQDDQIKLNGLFFAEDKPGPSIKRRVEAYNVIDSVDMRWLSPIEIRSLSDMLTEMLVYDPKHRLPAAKVCNAQWLLLDFRHRNAAWSDRAMVEESLPGGSNWNHGRCLVANGESQLMPIRQQCNKWQQYNKRWITADA